MKNAKHQRANSKKSPSSKGGFEIVRYSNGSDASFLSLNEESQPARQRHPFDLEERTALFGENIVRFSKKIPRNPTNNRLISQIVGSGTSVGANFCEANDSFSKKDFRYCAKRCIKEAKETRFFLRMIATSEPALADEARRLYREASEFIRIVATMCKT